MRKAVIGVLLLFFTLTFARVGAQDPAVYHRLLRQYGLAQAVYNKATALSNSGSANGKTEVAEEALNAKALQQFSVLYQQLPPTGYDSLRFHTCFKLGELHHYFDERPQALRFYNESLRIKNRIGLADTLRFKPLLYAGIIYYHQNKFDTALAMFAEAEALSAANHRRLTEAERLYNLLGVLYYERGNFRQAQNYFQTALSLLRPANPYYNELFVNYNINLAQLHRKLEAYDKAAAIYQQLLPRRLHLNELHHNIGTLYLAQGYAEKALASFRKVVYTGPKRLRLYSSMGEAYFLLHRHDSAQAYYNRAVALHQTLGINTDPVGYGLVLKNFGDLAMAAGNYTLALTNYQKALCQFYPAFQQNDVRQNPRQFTGVFSYLHLFSTLSAKAAAWHGLYRQRGQLAAAEAELQTYTSAFDLIAYVERTYNSDEARLFLARYKYAIRDKPIDAAFLLYRKTGDEKYLAHLYRFDQQNKATVLALNREANLEGGAPLPPGQQQERRLKTEITRLALQAAELTDTARLNDLSSRIRELEMALDKLPQSAARAGSVVHRQPSLTGLQALLHPQTALVSYNLSAEKLTTLVITAANVAAYQQPLPAGFGAKLQAEINALRMPAGNGNRPANTSGLYALLLYGVPVQRLQQLIVVPDDVLAYLPFESLQDSLGVFLVQKLAVQYQFSAALLTRANHRLSSEQTLSFAPFNHSGWTDSFPALPASGEEVSATSGKQLLNGAATKQAFLEGSRAYPVVHLATHAMAGTVAGGSSYIVFAPTPTASDNRLFAQEIYNLQLAETQLVILSACETGSGELVQGEGVMSLSRAFAYAGCPNIITSLWKADDLSTAYLSRRLHHYLQKGVQVAEALRQAKLDYLSDRSVHPRSKHPYYWAHFVFVGEYRAAGKTGLAWWIAAGVLFAGLLGYGVRKLYRKHTINRYRKEPDEAP